MPLKSTKYLVIWRGTSALTENLESYHSYIADSQDNFDL